MPATLPPATDLSRRDFLGRAATATAVTALAPRLLAAGAVAPPRPFEVAAPLYAWDLHDEGVVRILDNLQEMAAVNSVYLIGMMHPERRPYPEGTYPHNPARQTYQVEDARCVWQPDARLYGRVRPRRSDHAWLNQTDWLHVLTTEARKRGLRTGIEFSHTLIDRERMTGEFADLAQRNLHGEVTPPGGGLIKWLSPPCPNHPATADYFVALALDAVVNHDVDFVQSCLMSFDPGLPDQGGGCFCAHCQRTANTMGLDLQRTQRALLAAPKDQPALAEWTRFRNRSNLRLYQKVHDAIHARKPKVDLRYNAPSRSYHRYGVDLALLRPALDSIRLTDYAEQEGRPELMAGKRQWLLERRREVGGEFPLVAALGVRLRATPALIHEGVKIARETGMNGITSGHYDCATFTQLRAVRSGLVAAGIPVG